MMDKDGRGGVCVSGKPLKPRPFFALQPKLELYLQRLQVDS